MVKKRRKLKKSVFIVGIIILTILIILGIYMIMYSLNDKNKFIGTWTTDGVTIYEFKKDDTGTLILPLSKYKFTYKLKDKKIYIDFEDEKSKDSEYDYSFKDGNLVLKNINNTFEFKKQE